MKTFFAVFFAILAAVVVISLAVVVGNLPAPGSGKFMRVQADLQSIKTDLTLYESASSSYPTTEQGLQALVTQPRNYPRSATWYQFLKQLPKDPWGTDYIYRNPGVKNPFGYDLFSAGPDRKAGTADDDFGGG